MPAIHNAIQKTVTIANGQQTSSAARLDNTALVGLVTPAALTGVAFTFTMSFDDVTYVPVYKDDGTAYSVTVSTSRYTAVDYTKFVGCPYVKAVSGSAEGGARSIGLAVRGLS